MASFVFQILHKQWYKSIWLITICFYISDWSFRCGCGFHWSSTDVDSLSTTFTHWLLAGVGYYWWYWYWLDVTIIWKDSYTDGYRVDISYAAYWIKNLLFIFERDILTFFRPNCCLILFSACRHCLNKRARAVLKCHIDHLIIDKSVSDLNYIGQA